MSQTAAILIATKNRAPALAKTLESLCGLFMPDQLEVEVLVIDNGSSDHTWRLLEEFQARPKPFRLQAIQELRSGKSVALNKGLSHTSADFVLFTDDDMLFDSLWLSSIVEHFNQCDCVGVHGKVEVHCVDGRPSWLSDKAQGLYGSTTGIAAPDGTVKELYGLNMAARREAASKAGPFDETLGPQGKIMGYSEDVEWSRRLGKLGKLCYVPQAQNFHCIPQERLTKRSLWDRQFGMVRDEWRLRAQKGRFPRPWSEFLSELKSLFGALLYRKGHFEGFEYGLELASRCARVYALFEHSIGTLRRRKPPSTQESAST